MWTQKRINIPIFNYKLTIIITDTWEEVEDRLPSAFSSTCANAVTFANKNGHSLIAVLASKPTSIVHECVHIKNDIWAFIGYRSQIDNDEVDAYLITYLYEKIMEVFNKHSSS